MSRGAFLLVTALIFSAALLIGAKKPVRIGSPESAVRGAIVPVLVYILPFSAVVQAQTLDIRHLDFPTSGSPEAQKAFLSGVVWLHSFEYEEALKAFQEAERIEPGFAMAYWGEAMAYNDPIWLEGDPDAGRKALHRLGPTPEARLAKASSQRERGYIQAVEILYGAGDKKSRDDAYADAMGQLYERYPDDLEAASFYSLAILGTCEGHRDLGTYMRAAAVAEEVFAKNPQHPGATRYLLLIYDNAELAPLGLRAARMYAAIAPPTPRPLHMPSHIFRALGMWDDVISSNKASWEVSRHQWYHALQYMEYAYLQQGRYREARLALSLVQAAAAESSSYSLRRMLALMRGPYVVEARNWTGDAAAINIDTSDFEKEISLFASDLYVTGAAAMESGKSDGAEKALAKMKRQISTWSSQLQNSPTDRDSQVVDNRIRGARIAASELEAQLLLAKGRNDEAIRDMEDAIRQEDQVKYEFGTPLPFKPARELYGEMLLRMGRPPEARAQFALSLKRAPGRSLSLLGLARTATGSGDARGAKAARAALRKNWSHADPGLPELRELAK